MRFLNVMHNFATGFFVVENLLFLQYVLSQISSQICRSYTVLDYKNDTCSTAFHSPCVCAVTSAWFVTTYTSQPGWWLIVAGRCFAILHSTCPVINHERRDHKLCYSLHRWRLMATAENSQFHARWLLFANNQRFQIQCDWKFRDVYRRMPCDVMIT